MARVFCEDFSHQVTHQALAAAYRPAAGVLRRPNGCSVDVALDLLFSEA